MVNTFHGIIGHNQCALEKIWYCPWHRLGLAVTLYTTANSIRFKILWSLTNICWLVPFFRLWQPTTDPVNKCYQYTAWIITMWIHTVPYSPWSAITPSPTSLFHVPIDISGMQFRSHNDDFFSTNSLSTVWPISHLACRSAPSDLGFVVSNIINPFQLGGEGWYPDTPYMIALGDRPKSVSWIPDLYEFSCTLWH